MYEKDKTLLLVATASALPNNLSCKLLDPSRSSEAIGVIHSGYINIIPTRSQDINSQYISCTDSADRYSATVTQVMWCYLNYEACLVVASTVGLQIFDSSTLALRFSHACNDSPEDREHFARGLANPPGDYVCVGNNSGVLRMFGIADDGNLIFIDRKQMHNSPIADLACCKELLASCDDAGSIVLSSITPEEMIQWANIASYGSACTSIQIWRNILITGYGSGHIRLFSINENRREVTLSAEVCAHAKWITAIDVAPESGFVLSVSEDSFAKIWQIVKQDNISVVHKFSSQVKDCMLVGGKFLTLSGSIFAVSIYDSNLVQCFKM
ncbi:WD repeat-containing protein 54-like [Cimex lectularius]|uniref:WD repeat-containing protein 54 beta-propeller domain-containing protein n=1 Tax=Cimex lectularius TaxID=79782 RepID=A0A8I6TME8_CIMLE|nr:WD repeat-containing protein 54-like [Cimex lectularius]